MFSYAITITEDETSSTYLNLKVAHPYTQKPWLSLNASSNVYLLVDLKDFPKFSAVSFLICKMTSHHCV